MMTFKVVCNLLPGAFNKDGLYILTCEYEKYGSAIRAQVGCLGLPIESGNKPKNIGDTTSTFLSWRGASSGQKLKLFLL